MVLALNSLSDKSDFQVGDKSNFSRGQIHPVNRKDDSIYLGNDMSLSIEKSSDFLCGQVIGCAIKQHC